MGKAPIAFGKHGKCGRVSRYQQIVGSVICLMLYASSENSAASSAVAAVDFQQVAIIMFAERAVERVLIVLFSGMAVLLGYLLFSKVVGQMGRGEFQLGQAKATISRVGPGVFFCLFGVAGLIYALYAQPSVSIPGEKVAEGSGHGAVPGIQVVGAAGVSDQAQRQELIKLRVLALNSLLGATSLAQPENSSINEARKVTARLREDLVKELVGEDVFLKYEAARTKIEQGGQPAESNGERAAYDAVTKLFNQSLEAS